MLGMFWSPLTSEPNSGRPRLALYVGGEKEEAAAMAEGTSQAMVDLARTWFQREAFIKPPAHVAEPFSLQWFLALEHARYGRHGRWLPELLSFAKHPGESVLCLGNSLGTDWVQYARHAAQVTVCHPQQIHLGLVRRNFELRGLNGRFLHADGRHLPLTEGSVDVVCYAASLDEQERPTVPVDEIFRVLKPGGKVAVVVPARAPAWWRWLTSSITQPAQSIGFGTRQLRQLFPQFENHRLWRRHLRRRHLAWPCRWLPRTVLERIVGRFLVLNAFKPVAAVLMRAAA
jgi:SAM-dependent methyltransferase